MPHREEELRPTHICPVAPGAPPSDPTEEPKPSQAAQFTHGTLTRSQLDANPFVQFHRWFSEPSLAQTVPETVTLSTASLPSGRVSSRMVYLKELDSRGFVIYSNFGTSRKSRDLASNKFASLCFWWKTMERQVRVEGVAERLSAEESQVYFDTRARGSRIGAWASQQTSVLEPARKAEGSQTSEGEGEAEDDGRAELETRVREIEARFQGQEHIPVPPFWGGLRIIPETIEFWQGRESRLHDRFVYTRINGDVGQGGEAKWKIERLSP
ncbi:pyridoxamine 5'-phosphate oxidase [Cladophialophora yegresii CBS 114405]|uniref:pyridoxal 5'-phosphate synthase n=1 Tax=Cladophialophora yegresii CBS 114405 TaxID=1182544 RepID=W9VRC5_9EURO|nr:pyridoxamine 5'-phosphate oxidase [Cladophialophora yegresii CBS 114405]EXJ55570.1 pyridoxamine 5'-phosphate oxidase [Cladophialophora yegresii CBS 114405]